MEGAGPDLDGLVTLVLHETRGQLGRGLVGEGQGQDMRGMLRFQELVDPCDQRLRLARTGTGLDQEGASLEIDRLALAGIERLGFPCPLLRGRNRVGLQQRVEELLADHPERKAQTLGDRGGGKPLPHEEMPGDVTRQQVLATVDVRHQLPALARPVGLHPRDGARARRPQVGPVELAFLVRLVQIEVPELMREVERLLRFGDVVADVDGRGLTEKLGIASIEDRTVDPLLVDINACVGEGPFHRRVAGHDAGRQ